jgi:hypothetical protein
MRLAAIVPLSIGFVAHYQLRGPGLINKLSCVRNLPGAYILPYQ